MPYGARTEYKTGQSGYRVYQVEFAPGWNKDMLSLEVTYNSAPSFLDVVMEWVGEDKLKLGVVGKTGSATALMTFGKGEDGKEGGHSALRWEITSYNPGTGYKDQWTIFNDRNVQTKVINIVGVTP